MKEILCDNCKKVFKSYKDFNNHLFKKENILCKEYYKVEECECCKKMFRKHGLSYHILQHSKSCFEFYIKKYHEINNFPWKKLSDKKNEFIIYCKCCGIRCRGLRGISHHVIQHSKKCYDFYVEKFGEDRLYWPEDTFLNFKSCTNCGKKVGETHLKSRTTYCKDCRHHKFNVMNIPEIKNKMSISLKKTYEENPELKINLSIKAKERHKNNPKYAENRRQYMLNGGAAHALSFVQNPSKPQVELYDRIKEIFPNAILNYPVKELNYNLDIAIPELKIWFESDGSYYHQDKEKDLERQLKIEEFLGWKCIRYTADSVDQVPPIEKIRKDIENMILGIK